MALGLGLGVAGSADASSVDELTLADLPAPQQLLDSVLGTRLALLEVAPSLGPTVRAEAVGRTAATLGSNRSGLPWRSGAACGDSAFEAWRGRDLDTAWAGMSKASFQAMVRGAKGSVIAAAARQAPTLILSVPLLPQTNPYDFSTCARGTFDSYFRQIGSNLNSIGAGHAVVRLGKEANRGSSPWGYPNSASIPNYVACFRHAVTALRQGAPNLTIEWTNGRQSLNDVDPRDAYPGDSYVDIVGLHFYDNAKGQRWTTQEFWDAAYDDKNPNGSPLGLGAWTSYIQSLGKKVSVSEWGMRGGGSKADNPVYIENMFRYFSNHASMVAYESYYNCSAIHQIFPSTRLTKGRERYRALWSAGP